MVKQYPRSGGDVERGEEALVESFAANHIQSLFAYGYRADGKQAEGWAIRQLLTFQKRSGGEDRHLGRRCLRNHCLRISKLRLPLRGGDNGATIVDKFQKVQLMLGRQSPRFGYVIAGVGGAAVHIQGDVLHGFAGRNRLDLAHYVGSSALKFRSKLRGDRVRTVLIGLLK